MGANNSTQTETHVQIPRAEYEEKVKYYGGLEKTLEDEKLKCLLLKKELEEAKVQAVKGEKLKCLLLKKELEEAKVQAVKDEKLKCLLLKNELEGAKEQAVKVEEFKYSLLEKKLEEAKVWAVKDEKLKYSLLKKELEETKVRAAKKEESLKSQLREYESLPILKSILNTLTKIKKLDDEINKYQRSNTFGETTRIQNEIQELRISVDTLSKYIDQKVLNSLPNMQIYELRQLEYKVSDLSLNNKSRETKFEEIHMKLSAKVKEIMAEIENILLKTDEDIEDIRTLFNTTRDEKAHPDFHEIKSILMEQENVLLQYRLTRPQNHNLIFVNLPNLSIFGKSDYDQVQEILKFIGVHEDVYLNMQRVGRVLNDKPQLLKVTSSQSDLVEFVLNRRYKLKGSSEYSSVGIIPDKRENPA